MRHILFKDIEARKKRAEYKGIVPKQVFDYRYYQIHRQFEQIRHQIYMQVTGDTSVTEEQARRYMQKAFCLEAANAERKEAGASWPDLVMAESQNHSRLISEMAKG